jgi:hypothetical protein
MKRVGILTTFTDLDTSYSLASVVYDQLVMHIKAGYETVLYTLPSFTGKVPSGVEVKKIIPQFVLENYKGMSYPDNWKDEAKKVRDVLNEHARDLDYIIAHDWVFIDTYLPYNIGLREADLKARKFHWIHSAPSPRPEITDNPHANRYSLPPHSKLVYLNHDKALHLAEMYGTTLRNVRVVPNSIDPRTFWELDPLVETIIEKYDLFSKDIISVYPVSTPRMVDGKQLDTLIKIHVSLNNLGVKTALIVPNAHCNAPAEKESVKAMHELAQRGGLHNQLVFTSDLGFDMGVSRKVVSDLFRISNVFIFPSVSENCSLILHEARISGNLIVLNKDCTGFQEFGGHNALYFKMGNLDMGIRNYENALKKDHYYNDMAKIIKSEYENNKALKSKSEAIKQYNLDKTFSQIENLYYE